MVDTFSTFLGPVTAWPPYDGEPQRRNALYLRFRWWAWEESNLRPPGCDLAVEPPADLRVHMSLQLDDEIGLSWVRSVTHHFVTSHGLFTAWGWPDC